jgi:hypothetical protein
MRGGDRGTPDTIRLSGNNIRAEETTDVRNQDPRQLESPHGHLPREMPAPCFDGILARARAADRKPCSKWVDPRSHWDFLTAGKQLQQPPATTRNDLLWHAGNAGCARS